MISDSTSKTLKEASYHLLGAFSKYSLKPADLSDASTKSRTKAGLKGESRVADLPLPSVSELAQGISHREH